jgi:hypothetical protein
VDSHRPAKDEAILTTVAESIGATLGTIAAKAGSVQKALSKKVADAKPVVRRAAKAVVAKAVAKKRANMRGRRTRKARATGRTARRSRKKS